MNLNVLLSSATGTALAAADTTQQADPNEPIVIQILKLLMPSIVSVLTYYISHRVNKRRIKKDTSKK